MCGHTGAAVNGLAYAIGIDRTQGTAPANYAYTPVSACPNSLFPAGESFGTAGGLGSFGVIAAPGCNWTVTFSAGWITPVIPLPPPGGGPPKGVGNGVVTYAVGPNSGGLRTGSVSVGGQKHSVSQQGLACADTISPPYAFPDNTGGTISVSVSAPKGCSWTAASNAAWITVKSGASGSGGGVVVLDVAPSPGGFRSGTATIAGQTFSVTQGAGACGAVDVTSEMTVKQSGLTYVFPSSLGELVTVKNNSGAAVNGPVYLVLLGVPDNGNGVLGGSQSLTTCYSPQGDYLLLASANSMPAGQSVVLPLLFSTQGFGVGVEYTTKVLSGKPSH